MALHQNLGQLVARCMDDEYSFQSESHTGEKQQRITGMSANHGAFCCPIMAAGEEVVFRQLYACEVLQALSFCGVIYSSVHTVKGMEENWH